MVKKLRCSWRSFVIAALLSALASTLIVAVGPGFSSPNDNAAEQAQEATENNGASAVASTEQEEEEVTEVTTTEESSEDRQPHNPDVINPNASSVSDTHGHVGSGTGTTTGSQADPGHKDDDFKPADGKSNGPGTGDEDASQCTNKHQGADAPQGGANNNPGPYDNTCDGDNSENGQGSAAPGKGTPCAGCVGNADDKNPPGQVKEFNGQKPNDMGYECDGNQGVGAHYGRGNPAHTGDCDTTVVVDECPEKQDMDPTTPGKQCEPPPCVDDTSTEEDECDDDDDCPGNSGNSNGNSGNANPNCRPTDDCPTIPDQNPNMPGKQCTSPPDACPTDMNPFVDGKQCTPPPTCPPGSDMPGQPAPGGDRDNCYTSEPPVVCPADSDMPGEPIPGGDVDNCYEPPRLCPRGSDLPGQPMPGGDIRNCYVDTPLPDRKCPRGTDHAGQQIPNGDIRLCNDDVLGDVIDKDKPGGDVLGNRDGAAERPATRGRILPFTGASILAYLVLALELLGAGALILRARKR